MAPQGDKPVNPEVKPAAADNTAGKFYESAYKPFESKFNEVPNKDNPTATTPEQLKNGWQSGDANANEAFKGLQNDFKAFDTAEAKVREAQTGEKGLFKETTDAAGNVTRTYNAPAEKYSHVFNKDGSTELKTPTGESIVTKDGATKVLGADGKELDAAKSKEVLDKANKAFEGAKGEFTGEGGQKGNWKVDAVTGNTTVEKVPGVQDGSMTINHANTKDDVKYHGEVKANGGKPGYSTEATGDNKTGYRFVDYDDSKGQPDVKTKDNKSIEGFVAQRGAGADKPPLTLVSDKHAGDGSVTKIGIDGVAETTYDPPKNGKLSEKAFPPGHPSGVESQVKYDPAQNPDHVESVVKLQNGVSATRRATADGGYELTQAGPGGEIVTKVGKDDKPQWSRETDATGKVTTKFSTGETGVFTPAKPPATQGDFKVTGSDGKVIDPQQFLKDKGPQLSEKLSADRTRETKVDGTTVTTDTKTGITKTEKPPTGDGRQGTTEYSWKPETKPSKADLAQMTGLKETDPRLNGITSVKETKGSNVIEVNYGDKTPNTLRDGKATDDVKTSAQIRRDGDGNVIEELRNGKTKDGRGFTEYEDKNGTRTRTFEKKAGQVAGDQEVYNNKNEKIQDRKVDGQKITTTDYENGKEKRTEVLDTKEGTWKRTENGQTTEGKLLSGRNGQRLYMDGQGKMVSGLEIPPGGARGGDSYRFGRDGEGNITSMQVEAQGKKVNLKQEGGVWKAEPKGEIPGFPAANNDRDAEGNFKGKFSTNDKGELVYESSDKMTKQVLRGDGSRDTYDMREYSRVKEGADGSVGPKKYWDGYGSKNNPEDGWREGTATKDANGNITVQFKDQVPNHPSKTIRNGDGANDSFQVEFPNGTGFKVGNWNEGKMIRSEKGKPDTTLYNTGTVGNDGRVQWAKGTPDATTGRVKFDDPRVQSGEIPTEATIDKGKVTSTYADGTEVESNLDGKPTKIRPGHAGSKEMNRRYGSQGELKGFNQGTTTGTLERTDPVTGKSDWTINSGGQNYKIEGATVTEKPGGKFEIVGKDGTKYESNGRLSTKEGGKDVVYDARGQKWTKSAEGTKGDSTKVPPEPGKPPTWETGNPPKKFNGEMKMFDNGNVGVQTSNEIAETVNGDGSVSKIDKNGFERERVNKDGTYQKRGPQGELTEFSSKDSAGKTTVTKLDYDRDKDSGKLTGGVREVKTFDPSQPDKPLRTEKRDTPPPATPPAKQEQPKLRVVNADGSLGNEVTYDRMGTRSEIKGTPTDNTTTVTDVHGQTRNIKTVAGKRTEITGPQPGTTGDTKLSLTYGDANPDPTSITNGKDTYERVGRNAFQIKGSADKTVFTLDRDGTLKAAEDNIGIDPAFSMQLDQSRPRDTAKPGDAPASTKTTDQQWAAADKYFQQTYGLKPGALNELRNLADAAGLKAEQITPGSLDTILQASKEAGMIPGMDAATLNKMATALRPIMADPAQRDKILATLGDPNVDLNKIKGFLPEAVRPLINEKFIGAIKKAFMQPVSPSPK